MDGSVQEHLEQTMSVAWQHNKDLGNCMIELYDKRLWTDVKFRCKDHDGNERIHAHKVVLAARSPVFQALFFGSCADRKNEVELDNAEAKILDLFLRYIYSDKVTLTEENASSVLEMAHYYQVTKLVQFCTDYLATVLTSENSCEILALDMRSDKHDRVKNISDPNQNTAPVMNLRPSEDIPELVPKFTYIQPDQQQDALYQDFQRLVSIRPSHLSAVTTTGSAGKDSIVDIFKDAVFSLTSNPAPMDEYMKRVTDLLYQGVTDLTVINDVIETLFEQSISEPNFRFTGAKICNFLSNHLKSHPVFFNFRGLFLNRCKAEYDKREELLNNNVERLCGLSMFFGELFLLLEAEKDGIMTKIGVLRGAMSDLLRTLLSQPDDVTVKCTTQLLKLTGTALMETTDMPGNFDDIFNKIKSLEMHPQLNKTSHCLINSVLSRLEYNFGVGQQTSPQTPVQAYPGQQSTSFNNVAIFYITDVQRFTREEAGYNIIEGLNSEEQVAFLQWEAENYANQQWVEQGGDGFVNQGQWSNQAANGYVQQPWSTGMSEYEQWSTNQDQGFGYNESEYFGNYNSDMDDEMVAAYEMFLKESGQKSEYYGGYNSDMDDEMAAAYEIFLKESGQK